MQANEWQVYAMFTVHKTGSAAKLVTETSMRLFILCTSLYFV